MFYYTPVVLLGAFCFIWPHADLPTLLLSDPVRFLPSPRFDPARVEKGEAQILPPFLFDTVSFLPPPFRTRPRSTQHRQLKYGAAD